jgi:hypothetical protein
MFGGVFVFVVVILYITHKFITVSRKVKEVCSSELPYKVDPVHTTTTVDLAIPAIPHEPIKWTFANAPLKRERKAVKFDPLQQPKRPYVKRSKYWTDKRKKAVAAKARKTKRKSK